MTEDYIYLLKIFGRWYELVKDSTIPFCNEVKRIIPIYEKAKKEGLLD